MDATLSISATTRAPRPGERDGVDYVFKTEAEFLAEEREGHFLESAVYNGNRYGTPAPPVFEALALGKTVLLEIEVQGALHVRRTAPSALFVFIKTPTFRDLERRLRGRGTDSESTIHLRLLKAREELAEAHWYDVQLVNDAFDNCVGSFITLLKTYGRGGD